MTRSGRRISVVRRKGAGHRWEWLMAAVRRTLVVANRTAATPLLLEEVERRARERPTTFALLIPNAESKKRADWTLERAVALLEPAAGGPVDGLVGGADPFDSVKQALEDGEYDD